MTSKLVDLIELDLGQFAFSRIEPGTQNSVWMSSKQSETLTRLLNDTKPEIKKIMELYGKPDPYDMKMMGVKRNEVGYRCIKIRPILDDKTKLLKDWDYTVSYLTKDNGKIGMRFGDRNYTRKDLK